MKRFWLELKPGKDLLVIDCVYTSACTTEKTRSLGKANAHRWQSAESAGWLGCVGERTYGARDAIDDARVRTYVHNLDPVARITWLNRPGRGA